MVEARITSKTSFAVRAASLTFQLFCLIQHGRSKLIICSDPAEMFSIDVILRKKNATKSDTANQKRMGLVLHLMATIIGRAGTLWPIPMRLISCDSTPSVATMAEDRRYGGVNIQIFSSLSSRLLSVHRSGLRCGALIS